MPSQPARTAPSAAVKVAGVAYLLSTVIPVLSSFLVFFKLIVPEDTAATARNILAHELGFRIGIASDLVMVANALVLSMALYVLLKAVNVNVALFALLLRLGDSILLGVAALCGLLALALLAGGPYSPAFPAAQLQALAGLLLQVRSMNALLFFFAGPGAALSCYLFFKSGLVPKTLAAFGILSFLLLPIYAFVSILLPDVAAMVSTQTIFFTPSILFELAMGSWLLIKGVRTPAPQLQGETP